MSLTLLMALSLWISPGAMASPAEPARGYVDLHNHLFAELAFGGAWLHGHADGDEAAALVACDGGEDHGRVKYPWISRFIGRIAGSSGDTGDHADKKSGYPDYRGWPRWDTIAHQQVWSGHLKKAHQDGLTLLVVSAVNFEQLCELMPEKSRKYSCEDEESIHRQLKAAREYAAKNASWMGIAETPEQARSLIAQGKQAWVLSFEASHAFKAPDWRKSLDRYLASGVSTFQFVHQLNNRMAGPAMHNPAFKVFQWIEDWKALPHFWDWRPGQLGFQLDADGMNQRGLTDDGRELVREMIRRGVLIDVAHLSEKGVREVVEITHAAGDYPFYISHGHFKEMMDDGKFSVWEKSSRRWVLEAIRRSGGIFGLRTGPEKTRAFASSVSPPNPVANDCGGSTRSFAQTYQYGARDLQMAVGFSTDMNGFIQQLRPRFGGPEETCGAPPITPAERKREQGVQKQPLGRPFDRSGLGHIGQLGDVLQELKNFGVDTSTLEHSTEAFLKMWERARALSLNASKPAAASTAPPDRESPAAAKARAN